MKQLVLATLGLITVAGVAQAQIGTPGQRPTTRPIVNPFLSVVTGICVPNAPSYAPDPSSSMTNPSFFYSSPQPCR